MIDSTYASELIERAAKGESIPVLLDEISEQKKWIAKAIKKPGALRKELGAKEKEGPRGGEIEEPIPAGKLAKEKAKLQKKAAGEKKLTKPELTKLKRISLAQTLRKLPKRT